MKNNLEIMDQTINKIKIQFLNSLEDQICKNFNKYLYKILLMYFAPEKLDLHLQTSDKFLIQEQIFLSENQEMVNSFTMKTNFVFKPNPLFEPNKLFRFRQRIDDIVSAKITIEDLTKVWNDFSIPVLDDVISVQNIILTEVINQFKMGLM